MERARPGDGTSRAGSCATQRSGDDALDSALHLGRRAAREGQQQDAAGVGAVHDQVGDPVGERIGLARAGAGDDEQRTRDVGDRGGHAVLDGAALLWVESDKIILAGHSGLGSVT